FAGDGSGLRRSSEEPGERRSAAEAGRNVGERVLREANQLRDSDQSDWLGCGSNHGDWIHLRRDEYDVCGGGVSGTGNCDVAGDRIFAARYLDLVRSGILVIGVARGTGWDSVNAPVQWNADRDVQC